jgi:hypothetical protein
LRELTEGLDAQVRKETLEPFDLVREDRQDDEVPLDRGQVEALGEEVCVAEQPHSTAELE